MGLSCAGIFKFLSCLQSKYVYDVCKLTMGYSSPIWNFLVPPLNELHELYKVQQRIQKLSMGMMRYGAELSKVQGQSFDEDCWTKLHNSWLLLHTWQAISLAVLRIEFLNMRIWVATAYDNSLVGTFHSSNKSLIAHSPYNPNKSLVANSPDISCRNAVALESCSTVSGALPRWRWREFIHLFTWLTLWMTAGKSVTNVAGPRRWYMAACRSW